MAAFLGGMFWLGSPTLADQGYGPEAALEAWRNRHLFSLIILEGGGLLGFLGAFSMSRGMMKNGGALALLCALSGGVTPIGGLAAFAATVVLSVVLAVLGIRAEKR